MRLHLRCTVYGHLKGVCTESWLCEKNLLPHRGIEPASTACRSDALPAELHPTGKMVHTSLSTHDWTYKNIPRKRSPRAQLHVVGMLRFMSVTNQPSLPIPFDSLLVSISVFMALSTVFNSINSPDKSPFSHSVFPVLFLPYWSFQLYVSLWKSPSALI